MKRYGGTARWVEFEYAGKKSKGLVFDIDPAKASVVLERAFGKKR